MKAFILKIDNSISHEYAKICADSCNNVGLKWEYFVGYQNQTAKSAFGQLGIKNLPTSSYEYIEKPTMPQKAMCCTAGHFAIWKKIADWPSYTLIPQWYAKGSHYYSGPGKVYAEQYWGSTGFSHLKGYEAGR